MTDKKFYGILIIGLVISFFVGTFSFRSTQNDIVVGGSINKLHGYATSTILNLTTTSQLVSASSTNRTLIEIQNMGTVPVFLGFGTDAVSGKGVSLAPSSTPFILDLDRNYTGSITALIKEGTGNLSVVNFYASTTSP